MHSVSAAMVKAGESSVVAGADVIRSTTGVGVTSSIMGTGAAQRIPVTFAISISVEVCPGSQQEKTADWARQKSLVVPVRCAE